MPSKAAAQSKDAVINGAGAGDKTRPLDVVFFRHSLLNRGGDRIVLQYANYLSRRGYRVTIYVNEVATAFDIDGGVCIKRVPFPTKLSTLLYGAFSRWTCDVVIVDIIPLVFIVRRAPRVLYFAQAHDVMYYRSPVIRRIVGWLYARFFGSPSHQAIAVSQSLADMLKTTYRGCQLTVVENGIDLGRFFHDPDQHLIEAKQGRRAIVILARSDSYRKGGDIGERILRELVQRPQGQHCEIWVIGDSPQGTIQGMPVSYFGRPSDDRLRQILSSADILLYPSRHEGFGLFPLEAMACGCVVVTTSTVPFAKDGETALVFSANDERGLTEGALAALFDDELRRTLRANGFLAAKCFDLKKSGQQFERAIFDVLGPRRSSPGMQARGGRSSLRETSRPNGSGSW